jgi:hypothetical protein
MFVGGMDFNILQKAFTNLGALPSTAALTITHPSFGETLNLQLNYNKKR